MYMCMCMCMCVCAHVCVHALYVHVHVCTCVDVTKKEARFNMYVCCTYCDTCTDSVSFLEGDFPPPLATQFPPPPPKILRKFANTKIKVKECFVSLTV